jgi:CheY-like chemotaxis protein
VSRREQAETDLRETRRELEKSLSHLKAAQQQLIQQERLSAIGQMVSGVAHDFNNTLTPILGLTDLLLENDASLLDDKAEARRCLEMLRASTKDAASVVNRLREFYRPADAESPGVAATSIAAEATPRSSLKILIVDDEPSILEVVSACLRCDGHMVATAASGREALEKFRRNRFDLVVLDRVMPEMSGDQTAHFIKQLKRDIPVIMLTGFGALIEVTGSQSQTVDVVLSKPVTIEALRSTIGKLLHAA